MTEEAPITFAVSEKGTIGYAPPALTEGVVSATPRPLRDTGREKQDALRRPQAAVLYRALKAAGDRGLSWRECWALSDDEEFVVGPIVIWMRFHGCDIEALYDAVAGETRFYLRGT